MSVVTDMSIGAPGTPDVDDEADDWADQPTGAVRLEGAVLDPITEDRIRRALNFLGGGVLAYLFADDDVPDHWEFTDDELDDIVPPLTALVNRTPKLAALARRADDAALAWGLGAYMYRNIDDGRLARKARKEAADGDQHGQALSDPHGADRGADGVPDPGATGGGQAAGPGAFGAPGAGINPARD